MNEAIRSQFAALNQYAYLNSAAVSPIPRVAVEAVISQLNDVAGHGSEHYTEWVATKDRARALIAGMLNVQPEQVAFMRNTSDGFAAVANSIEWKKGDNIVSFEAEFPANFYPWRMVRDRYGVELRLCPERDGRIDLDEFISLIDSNSRLVAISAVQYASGFTTDLERIGRATRAVDSLFAVDIIQALGAKGFDLPAQYAEARRLEGVLAVAHAQGDLLAARRPDPEPGLAVFDREGAEAALEGIGARHLARAYP